MLVEDHQLLVSALIPQKGVPTITATKLSWSEYSSLW